MSRPVKGVEYAEYYDTYVSKVPDGDIVEYLAKQRQHLADFLGSIPEEKGSHRYAEGKWSVKEVLGHVVDIERVFSMRALAFARGDKHPWPGVEQDDFVAAANFDSRTVADLREEFLALRDSNVVLFRSLNDEEGKRSGVASGIEFTVRAIAWILAGHARHHEIVLAQKYL